MRIIKVTFHDWNGEKHVVDVTSDMCTGLNNTSVEEDLIVCAIRYIKRRYTECFGIDSVEIIAM